MLKLFKKGLPAIFTIASIVLLVAFYFSSEVYSEMNTPLEIAAPETLNFSRGSSVRTLANQLMEKGLLHNKNYFLIWGKLNRQETRLHAGEYVITPGLTLAELLDNMVAGKVVQHGIVLIEGYTFRQVLEMIQRNIFLMKR
jgi:UPF0755 protein